MAGSGARTFSIDAVPLRGGRLVIALHETTSQRRAERIRRDFVANISHELRTPLASIKLLAETLSEGAVEDPQTAHDFALQIEREVDHLAQLVDELLDLSMIESGETQLAIEPVEPWVLVRDVAERIGPVAERRGVTVVADRGAPSDGPRVAADPARLGQALLNLAHNAVKYSHPGGEVRIGWEAGPTCARFTVADDGIGIPSRIGSASSSASTRSTGRARVRGTELPAAARGWAWPSCGTWRRRTAAAWGSRARRAPARPSGSRSRSPDRRIAVGCARNHLLSAFAHGNPLGPEPARPAP